MNRKISSAALRAAYIYLDSNPGRNIPRMKNLVDKFDRDDYRKEYRAVFHNIIEDKNNNWYQLLLGVWNDLDAGVRKAFFQNFIINAGIFGSRHQDKLIEEYHCNIPWAILMDPTSACNLKCTGCWAAEYGNHMSMSLETLNSLIEQRKKLGVYFYVYSGGEPLLRKNDIIKLCEKHTDCMFMAFTNGTLIDEQFADGMLQ